MDDYKRDLEYEYERYTGISRAMEELIQRNLHAVEGRTRDRAMRVCLMRLYNRMGGRTEIDWKIS